jgi:hypothetical protein
MDTGPRAADRAPAGRILGRLMHQLGRFCMSINHKQWAPVRHPETNNCTSWAPGSLAIDARQCTSWAVAGGSLGADRGPLRAAAAPRVADRGPLGGKFGAKRPGHGRAGFTGN